MANPRAGKVAERIQQIIARRLEKGLRDPRLGFVTITDVRVTGDLQHASIFYTVFGDEQELADSAAALKAATGMLRTEVGKQLGTRLTPTLEFIHDELPETADHLNELLAEARRRDAEAQALAQGAQYAGDADPYVKPRDGDSDSDADVVRASEDDSFDEDADDQLDELEDVDEIDDSEDYEDDESIGAELDAETDGDESRTPDRNDR